MMADKTISCLVALAMVALLPSCGVCRKAAPSVEARDSVVIVRRDSIAFRDSIIYVPVPKESLAVETFADSSHLETSLAISDAVVRDGKLRHTLQNRPNSGLSAKVALPSRFVVETAHKEKETISREVVEVEKRLTSWQSFRLVLGDIALGVLALIFVWIAIKVFLLRDF